MGRLHKFFDWLFWIVILALSVWFFSSFVSCSTTHKMKASETVEVEDLTQIDTRKDSTATAVERRKDSLLQQIAEGYEVEVIRRDYDTNKPRDSVTGKPPIKTEERTRIRAKRETTTAKSSETVKADSTVVSVKDSTRKDVTTQRESEIKTTEKRRPPWTLLVIGLVVGVAAMFIVRKVLKR